MHLEPTDIVLGQNKIEIFHLYFLNKDFSVTIAHRPFKFKTCILDIQMEGICLKILI